MTNYGTENVPEWARKVASLGIKPIVNNVSFNLGFRKIYQKHGGLNQ